jgi:sugar lactone lactonase YvrE
MNRTRSLFAVSIASFILTGCGVNPSTTATSPPSTANVYVASSSTSPQIYTIPANSTGSPTPTSTITIPALNAVNALTVDSSGNIYAATDDDLREYAAAATGTATPIRTIPFDSTTTLSDSFSIAVDSSGNIYAAQYSLSGTQITSSSILVFSSSASGSVAPIRTISGALTGLVYAEQIAVDSSGNLYVNNLNPNNPQQSSILVFAPAATGNVAPVRSLNQEALAMAVDPAGDIYALTSTGISIFAPGASGSAAPTQTIANASLGDPAYNDGLAVDASGNIYYTSNGTVLNNVRAAVPTIYRIAAPVAGSTTALNNFTPAGWSSSATPLTSYFFAVH